MVRPGNDETWLRVAGTVARRSRCSRSQVGAAIVDTDGRLVSTGYNGPPFSYKPADNDSSCVHWCQRGNSDSDQNFDMCPSVHAELNALLYCRREEAKGATLYITKSPCLSCCKAIAQAGIARVVFIQEKNDPRSYEAMTYLYECGVRG